MLTANQQAAHIVEYREMIERQVSSTGCAPQEIAAAMAGAIRTVANEVGMTDEIKEQCATMFCMALGLKR